MVEALVANKLLKSSPVIKAFLAVDRGHFVNPNCRAIAYQDRPLPTVANVTISAPHMHAMMAELIFSHFSGGMSGKRVLDVGSGSGLLTAVLAELVGPTGLVVGIEHIHELVQSSTKAIASVNTELAQRIQIFEGDGRVGCPSLAPFDAIHVGAAAPTFPAELAEQLSPGGVMVVPVGPRDFRQDLLIAVKDASGIMSVKSSGGVMFVPLTSLQEQ